VLTVAAPTSPAVSGHVCPGSHHCIKGNINVSSERTYHYPDCPYYEATKIDDRYGERWLVSTAEAEATGWKRAKDRSWC